MSPREIEKAARILCKLRGVDPDQQCGVRTQPAGSDAYHITTQWRNAAEEIQDHLNLTLAIALGKDTPT